MEQERVEAEKKQAQQAELQRLRKIEEAKLAKEEAQRLAVELTDYVIFHLPFFQKDNLFLTFFKYLYVDRRMDAQTKRVDLHRLKEDKGTNRVDQSFRMPSQTGPI